MRSSVLALGVLLLALPVPAQAHFTLLAPPPASNSMDGGKGSAPCGPADSTNVVTPVTGGSKLLLKVNETVPHPGFYRVALSIKSRTELPVDNVVKNANGVVLPPAGPGTSASAVYQDPPVFPVLADNLWPHTSAMAMFSAEITLPNVNCDKCTLQVIEFMASHGPDYFYRHCADLKITADPSKPIFDPTASGAGGGSSAGAGGIGGGPSANGGASAAPGSAGAAFVAGGGGTGGSSVSGAGGSSGATPGPSAAGAAFGSVAGASSVAGAKGTQSSHEPDSGGCAVSNQVVGSKPLLSLLLGLLVLGRRRHRRR